MLKLHKRITKEISIHATREGGDHISGQGSCHRPISIHATREGGDSKNYRKISRRFLQNVIYSHSFAQIRAKCNRKFDIRQKLFVYSIGNCGAKRQGIAVRLRFAPKLYHQYALRLVAALGAEMLDLTLVLAAEIVKPQAVQLVIHDRT